MSLHHDAGLITLNVLTVDKFYDMILSFNRHIVKTTSNTCKAHALA